MAKGTLVGQPIDVLQTLVTQTAAAIVAVLVRGKSYTIAGRSYTFSELSELQDLSNEASYALGLLTGARSNNVRANFNPALGRGGPYYGNQNPAIGQ